MSLHGYLLSSAERRSEHPAVEEESGAAISYGELDALSARLRDRLARLGVAPGDRVGLCLRKSADGVAAIFGILRRGAAYVPVDADAPLARCAYILDDCGVKVVLVEEELLGGLSAELAELGARPRFLALGPGEGAGARLSARLDESERVSPAEAVGDHPASGDELAYILYTSGSTGLPKGVMLSHRNATSFVDWCSRTFQPVEEDRFSSHAPFHFDLSILDLYTPLKHGATLVLVSEGTGKDPVALARLIADVRISVWYSVPSILALLAQYGQLGTRDYSGLRAVLFAGEVFPVAQLRALVEELPHCSFHNLYGPTETNVCTSYEIPLPIPPERSRPFPIGPVCDHLEGLVVDPDGTPVEAAEEGELCISGPNVMLGYWNRPEQTEESFLVRDGQRWYRTGDLVVQESGEVYAYVGRRDRMIKKRGFRIELGEIEACMYRHPEIREAAIVARQDEEAGVQVWSHLVSRSGERLSIIELKRFCSDHVPVYMVPDKFRFHESLPRTSTGKVDYQTLQKLG